MKAWLWPDQTIGKRESRQLREEYNRVYNFASEVIDELTRQSRAACMDQRVSGECICFSCVARRLVDKAAKL